MKISCCLEHVGLALDEIVDEQEVAPFLIPLEIDEQAHCQYCNEPATYSVADTSDLAEEC